MILEVYKRLFSFVAAFALVVSLGGCHDDHDIEYEYDVPADVGDCPAGMEHRSGGTGIVDRSGGTGIIDRDGNAVKDYCFQPTCPGGNYDNTVPAEMDWHQDSHQKVVAERTCLAIPVPVPGPGTGGGTTGGGTGGGGDDTDDDPEQGDAS